MFLRRLTRSVLMTVIKWKFLRQSFCFFFIQKSYFHMNDISFLQHTKMFNFDDITNENNEEHNLKWLYSLDHSYRILITGGSG